jgi:rod shape-determining protein MreC
MFDLLKRFRLFVTALFFLFFALLLLTFNVRQGRDTSIVEKGLLQASFPLQQGAHKAFIWFKELGEDYIFLLRAQEENRHLKKTVSELREENNRLREAVLTDERLRKLQQWQSGNAFPSRVAQVYARGPSTWFKTILVNRGEKDGVAKDMAVATSEGLVGRVIEVSANTAKVLLITDANSAVDVIVQSSRAQGILEGKIEDTCILKYVQKSEEVQVGDRVITSGLGGIFPKGLVVGTVTKGDRKRQGIFQYIEVAPAVDLSKLEEVLILGEEPRP